jgi:hypothetical protein
VLAVLALVGIVVIWMLAHARAGATGASAPSTDVQPGVETSGSGARYWLIVAAEVVLIVVGIAVLRSRNAPQEANVAWIAFVVGIHLIAFVTVWKQRSIVVPGAILAVLGISGLVMAATPAVAWVPFVSGVLSGITLLTFSLAFAASTARDIASRTG